MKDKQSKKNPRQAANCISRCTYWWLLDIFRLGNNNDIHADDIYEVLPEYVSGTLSDQLEKYWETELAEAHKRNGKPKLWKAIRKTFARSLFKQGLGTLTSNLCRVAQLIIMAKLISYFDPLSTMTVNEAYITASVFMITTLFLIILNRKVLYSQYILGMRVKIACSSLIYRKVLKLCCPPTTVNALVVNIMSNDLGKFDTYFSFMQYSWLMPLIMVLIAYLMWLQVGLAAFAGILCMMLQIIPIQVIWYKMMKKLRAKSTAETDKRVLLIGEVINGIRVIKMYAWEKYFQDLVCLVRAQEIKKIFMTLNMRGVNFAMAAFTDRSALLCMILAYVWLGNEITAGKIFTTIGFFVHLRLIVLRIYPDTVYYESALKVVLDRIERFLFREEIKSTSTLTKSLDNSAVIMRNVDAAWGSNMNINHIDDIDLRMISKKMYTVVGPVGSGKSSLLKLILGELQPKTGQILVYGKVSYASQEPWLFTGSVRDNILFGEAYNEERYRKVVKVCQLSKDFKQLPFEDRTLVGERGMSLSGGQCARVNLARAIYRDVDIYLLDDPLSAVDSHVSSNLFEQCINGFLKNKTRILVTHQIQYLKNADSIIMLNKGQVEFQGDFQTFVETEEILDYLSPNTEEESNMEVKSLNELEMSITEKKNVKDEKSAPEETKDLIIPERIKIALLLKYFKAGGLFLTFLFIILLFLITQIIMSGFDYWISFWVNQEEKRDWQIPISIATNTTIPEDQYLSDKTALYVSGGLTLAMIFLSIFKNIFFFERSLKSSKNIHNIMFSRLLKAPMRFFNANPSGRMMNRFSKDTGSVDDEMPIVMVEVIERTLIIISAIIQITIVNWWLIGPIFVAVYIIAKVNKIYFSTAQNLKRLESNAKSPVFSLVNSTLLGLPTIRSCCAQKLVRHDFDARQDANSAVQYLCLVTTMVYGLSLDLVACGVLAFMVYTFIPLKSMNIMGGDVGLALTQFVNVCTTIQYLMRQYADLVFHMTAVERMFQYTELEQEASYDTEPGDLPGDNWPSRGEIKFENLSLSYSEKEQPVLQNLNFIISPNMKVGIVGRTGAGKSSLITALFRLAEPDGAIFIDNVNTKRIGMLDLRSRISIIPQEPTIFTTSLRDNLDPLHQYDDASLWSILQEIEMNQAFQSLDQSVDGNLSAGQRQLLCLARAIIRKNKILVLDEATANVDPVTDELIRKIIRNRFKDCTVLTIAHRLNTVVDNDAIIVMEAGQVVEFDQPYALLQKERGYLKDIVKKSGSASSLTKIAEKVYDENSSSVFKKNN